MFRQKGWLPIPFDRNNFVMNWDIEVMTTNWGLLMAT
jgi:hypothetical protein